MTFYPSFSHALIKTTKFVTITALFGLLNACGWSGDEQPSYDSLSLEEQRLPENALAGLTLSEGLQATLFASEPMITNPSSMDVDHQGRVWVCEGFNYRPELNPGSKTKKEGDRILILEDTDGDGEADKTTVFYQGNDVNSALGIKVMGHQAIVSCSPHVLLLTDTDGDDKADKKEILLQGIGGEQHDHGIHSFVSGPDGKFYFNYGNEGQRLLDKDGNPVKEQTGSIVGEEGKPYRQGMVFRVNPDGSDLEVLGHNFRNSFELTVDEFGTIWQSDNDDDGNQGVRVNYVMEYGNYGYRDEMTGENWRTYRTNMEEEIPLRHWHLNDPGVVPNLLQTGAGAPTGILINHGAGIGKERQQQLILADAGVREVNIIKVQPDGAGFKATKENLISAKDPWFRPSDITIAPDGSMFMADWYDPGVGGHQVGDLQRGRIYRITSSKSSYHPKEADLSTPEKAVAALTNPNEATRYLAWEALHSMGNDAEEALNELSHSENARHRSQALWLLSKIEGKEQPYIEQALSDQDENVRVSGIRMARQSKQDILSIAEKMAQDPSAQVRREVAIALRYQNAPKADEIWVILADQYDGKDRWYLEALGIGADMYADQRFATWMETHDDDWNSAANADLVWRSRADAAVPLLAELISDQSAEVNNEQGLPRYFRAFDFHKMPEKQQILASLAVHQTPANETITLLALHHLDVPTVQKSPQLKAKLQGTLESIKGTREYLELIKKFDLQGYQEDLLAMAINKPNEEVGAEAMKLLLEKGGDKQIKTILDGDHQEDIKQVLSALKRVNNDASIDLIQSVIVGQDQPLATRQMAVQALEGSWGGEDRLLEIVKNGDLKSDLDSVALQLFAHSMRTSLYDQASAMLNTTDTVREERTLAPIDQLIVRQGNVESGKQVFNQVCQSCHQIQNQGVDFGPALSTIGDKLPKEGLYKAILEPSAGISFGYEGYQIKLKDGSTIIGYLLSRSESQIQVRQFGGLTSDYPMDQVDQIIEMDNSLMPDHLENAMTEQQLVDLVEYLSSLNNKTAI